jgi:hypothetical protein
VVGGTTTSSFVGFKVATPVLGSISPTTTSNGYTYQGLFDRILFAHGSGYQDTTFALSGFSADPQRAWLTSVSCAGVTLAGSSATYSYASGTATWKWTTGPLWDPSTLGTTQSCSIVHQ